MGKSFLEQISKAQIFNGLHFLEHLSRMVQDFFVLFFWVVRFSFVRDKAVNSILGLPLLT